MVTARQGIVSLTGKIYRFFHSNDKLTTNCPIFILQHYSSINTVSIHNEYPWNVLKLLAKFCVKNISPFPPYRTNGKIVWEVQLTSNLENNFELQHMLSHCVLKIFELFQSGQKYRDEYPENGFK